jgi:hypothetical protein
MKSFSMQVTNHFKIHSATMARYVYTVEEYVTYKSRKNDKNCRKLQKLQKITKFTENYKK